MSEQHRRYSDSEEEFQRRIQKDVPGLYARFEKRDSRFDNIPTRRADPSELFQAVREHTSRVLFSSISIQPEKNEELSAMSFNELAEFFASKGINLQREFRSHLDFMVRFGIIKRKDVFQYRSQYETIHVRKSELRCIPKGWRPMFFVDNMTPFQALNRFIVGGDIRVRQAIQLSQFKKVDSDGQNPSGVSRLVYTPGFMPEEYADFFPPGIRYLEPAQWFQMFAEDLDRVIAKFNLGNGKGWKDVDSDQRKSILNYDKVQNFLGGGRNVCTEFPDWRDEFGNPLWLKLHLNPFGEAEILVYRFGFSRGNPQSAYIPVIG